MWAALSNERFDELSSQHSSPQPNSNNSGQKTFKQLSKLPQIFELNQGQFDTRYDYIAHTPETFFAFAKDHVNLVLDAPDPNSNANANNTLKMRFVGTQRDAATSQADSGAISTTRVPIIKGLKRTKQKIHYYRGKPSQWIENIPTFSKVEYADIYSGIDLQFYFNKTQMEFDFIVEPGENPKRIVFTIEDADKVEINAAGELVISLNGKTLIQKKPIIYQLIREKKLWVEGGFKQDGDLISFNIGDYDDKFPLVIDPVIEFSSYFGGEWEDQANVIRADSLGNTFVGGASSARARITVDNILNAENTAISALENTLPGNIDQIFQTKHGISLDADVLTGATLDLTTNKKIIVTDGVSQEIDFTYNCDYEYRGFFNNDRMVVDYDGFITKFDKDFVPVFTTYFGGCRNDSIRAMAIDANDNVYVTGITLSTDFPVKFPAIGTLAESRFADDPIQADAFYAKFDTDGALIFASYLGGDGQDGGRDIAVDADENIYLIGYTHSRDLPTTPCPTTGKRVIACDNIGGIDVAAAEAGSTDISVFSDAFVAKIATSGSNNVISFLTYFGGKFDDWGQSIMLHDGAIYISGNTASPDLPVGQSGNYSFMPYNVNQTNDEVVANRQELFCTRVREEALTTLRFSDSHICQDVFLAKLSLDGTDIIFSTYFGGDDDDNISQISADSLGNIYLIGTTKSKGARLTSGTYDLSNENILESRFPLFKNMNQFEFDLNTVYTSSFFTVFTPDADKLIVSSFIGGDNNDTGNALAIKENPPNGDGETLVDVYLAGHTLSKNFYTMNAFQSYPAKSDIYLLKLALNQSKFNDLYDAENPDNTNLCSKNSCNLYDIKYSTLLGGEDLDSLKSMTLLPNNAGVAIAGVTFSKYFPITSNAVKSTIKGIKLIEYEPFTRNEIDEYIFHPSDMLLLQVSDGVGDVSDSVDIQLSLNIDNQNSITESERINYSFVIENTSTTTTAKSVRLVIHYPYVARLEDIKDYITINEAICAEGFEIDVKQTYCSIGDLAATESKRISFGVLTRNSGNFAVDVSVSSMTSDTDSSNNNIKHSLRVKVKPDSGALSGIFIFFMLFFFCWRFFAISPLNSILPLKVVEIYPDNSRS